MKIATWNINSVRARMTNVQDFVNAAAPDVILLQEIKCESEAFPMMELRAMGYEYAVVAGQKSYNGVAILSKTPITEPKIGLDGNNGDEQARYVEGTVGDVRVASLYLPNGNPVESEKFAYKLDWMDSLKARAAELLAMEVPIVLGGDFNIIPKDEDVFDPEGWRGDALFRPESRAKFRALLNLGYRDAFRALHPDARRAYSFWDYQAGCWPQDKGLRIDHFLVSPEAADRMTACVIDKAPRAQDKASDHTPVILTL